MVSPVRFVMTTYTFLRKGGAAFFAMKMQAIVKILYVIDYLLAPRSYLTVYERKADPLIFLRMTLAFFREQRRRALISPYSC